MTDGLARSGAPTAVRSIFCAITDFLIEDRRGPEGLSAGDRLLATCGCLMTLEPNGRELRFVFHEAIANGVDPLYLQSILVHAVGYLGVLRTRQAYRLLVDELGRVGRAHALDSDYAVDPDREARAQAGARLYDEIRPGRPGEYNAKFEPISPRFYPRGMELAGLALASPLLSLREREVITVAMLACLGGQPDQLRFHFEVLLGAGADREVAASILMLIQVYAGIPRATVAADAVLAVIKAL